jgi:hypothetical protein
VRLVLQEINLDDGFAPPAMPEFTPSGSESGDFKTTPGFK